MTLGSPSATNGVKIITGASAPMLSMAAEITNSCVCSTTVP
jgi:hypothetical protein